MTDSITDLLAPIQSRVEEAEAKSARSRATRDPIFDAAMMLAIQSSSADVPTLLSALASAESALSQMSEVAERVYEKFDRNGNGSINSLRQAGRAQGIAEAVRVIRAAVLAQLEECTCALVGCRHQPSLTAEARRRLSEKLAHEAATTGGLQ